ncbi:FKBP-type peptidyl-prolyl cis-trans isomerase [Nocardia stercoris]|uniref:Peptidyl-prolyl cis-trans isomerase n=1 Tax=Nocardia stercoris TaxID=2483361 RepID=A0A3M2KS13_9NOCA|nr:FKBP-type peptidyl-prolyl cis-trans isomerase [Nocardia stercoris]RMI28432.1 FKBP-type peptidyl-prolyl cis-trans isomerase [Nocardia stercoris]
MQNSVRIIGTMTVVAAALGSSACSSGNSASSATSSTVAMVPTTPSKGHPCTADDVKVAGEFGEAPTITIPDGCDPPTTLLTKDLVVGAGPGAMTGQQLQTNYSLVTWSDKKQSGGSFGKQPFTLVLGSGTVISGWEQGLVGIQQGGRRLLIVPPQQGYAAKGSGKTVLGNETLVFVTDAVKVG